MVSATRINRRLLGHLWAVDSSDSFDALDVGVTGPVWQSCTGVPWTSSGWMLDSLGFMSGVLRLFLRAFVMGPVCFGSVVKVMQY